MDVLLLPPEVADPLRLALLIVPSGLALVMQPRVVKAAVGDDSGLVVLQVGAVRPRLRVRVDIAVFADELARSRV